MSTKKLSLEQPRVVCQVDASAPGASVVSVAGAYCRQRDAELVLVWVLEPSSFQPTQPFTAGSPGIWGLAGPAALALALGREEGVDARVVVRIGDRGTVLEEERRAAGAEREFTRADVASSGRAVSPSPSRSTRLEPKAA